MLFKNGKYSLKFDEKVIVSQAEKLSWTVSWIAEYKVVICSWSFSIMIVWLLKASASAFANKRWFWRPMQYWNYKNVSRLTIELPFFNDLATLLTMVRWIQEHCLSGTDLKCALFKVYFW